MAFGGQQVMEITPIIRNHSRLHLKYPSRIVHVICKGFTTPGKDRHIHITHKVCGRVILG